jgi:hypothetical protein
MEPGDGIHLRIKIGQSRFSIGKYTRTYGCIDYARYNTKAVFGAAKQLLLQVFVL